MLWRGFSSQIVFGLIGIFLVLGAIVYSTVNSQIESDLPKLVPISNGVTATTTAPTSTVTVPVAMNPKPVIPAVPKPKPIVPPPAQSADVSTPQTPSIPVVTPEPIPPSVPWSPNFQASTRVTPEIPSENERALLPSCTGKQFTSDFVNGALLKNISDKSSSGGSVSDALSFNFLSHNVDDKYNLTAPGDVYVTHIVQEYGVSADATDATIYFALCKDVFGYFTNIKEMSNEMTRLLNNSECAIKPHTGPNACYTKFLDQIGSGSMLGKVGALGGSFSFGVIDLRSQRLVTDPASYLIRTVFSQCPFSYLSDVGMKSKLDSLSVLCAGYP